jgi:hypothetical protein
VRIGLADATCDATGVCLDTSALTSTSTTTAIPPGVYDTALQNVPLTQGPPIVDTTPILSPAQAAALPDNPPSSVNVGAIALVVASLAVLLMVLKK